jgi:3-oxoacyl-[acyl-carrier-protein] synthase II
MQGDYMARRVVVTGMGTVNPLGNNVKDSWKAIRAGENGIGMIGGLFPAIRAARLPIAVALREL